VPIAFRRREPLWGGVESDPAAKWGRNVPLALEVLGEILGEKIQPGSDVRDMRLCMKAAAATIKAAISTDKNMLKPRAANFPTP
jgi:hypothetical protein